MKMDEDSDLTYGDCPKAQTTTEELEDQRKLEEWAARLRLSVADVQVFCRNGFFYERIPPHDGPNRRHLLAHLKKSQIPLSKWLLISGLYPERLYSEPERRKCLRALYKAVVLLIRRALALHEADRFKDERTLYWDPIAEVCRDLEIAPSKLSSFCKEFSGNSLSQVVDCVRAERIKKMMWNNLRGFIRQRSTQCATFARNSEGKIDDWSVWTELKKSRRWPEFSQNTWAMEFGFSSYRRMYRACLCVYGQSPHQLEMMLIREIISESEITNTSIANEEKELSIVEIQQLIQEIEVYKDDSMMGPDS